MSSKITFDSSEDEVLRGIITDGIITEGIDKEVVVEDDDGKKPEAVKVFKTIGGLTNLGRTYFWNQNELNEKRKWVEAQMVQKYGAEIYGISAQLKGQDSDKTSSSPTSGGLIQCSVKPFVDLTHVKKEAHNKKWENFSTAREAFWNFLVKKDTDADWRKKCGFEKKDVVDKQVRKLFQDIVENDVPDKNAKTAWESLKGILGKDQWKTAYNKDSEYKKFYDKLTSAWDVWSGKTDKSDANGQGKTSEHLGGGSNIQGDSWCPETSMRIDIHTDFNETWFKRKFKSGFLNKMIFAIKTDAMSRAYKTGKEGDMAGHKYTADEMLPQDKRKLDSLQWKMTNKVAKDYISMLLGWSRKKELKQTPDGNVPTQLELKPDDGFGQEMAKKALDNRGILGRLKQMIFSGGQSNNVISVCFQMADPNDGEWKIVEDKDGKNAELKEPEDGGETDTEQGNDEGRQQTQESVILSAKLDDMIMESLLKGE